ncbi:hypothetical protein FIU97_10035 [Roseivivax sp. THAF40]|uniref:DUF6477 family protein n=1 Tax=unclassified Roseivivax TaxID=2639302 RepID=UPI001267FF0D|nr:MULTISPECIES: DUF6477 family protein [unclassified Roseivivax]QFS83166.1 hypothetical protein FIV09_10050 [Roseivivax sp. THAF197b]QFT46910.1 hypothetical protein FIU97_10035 [Roseivivax sp. THAF40]
MSPNLKALACLRRPRLLIRAARIGAEEYRRSPHLDRLLGHGTTIGDGVALDRLMSLEAEQEELRASGSANYGVARHVEILAAMMGEARLVSHACPTLA